MRTTPSDRSSAFLPRLFLGTVLATAILLPSLYQTLLTSLWTCLYHSSFYRLSTFETILTISSYAVLEPLYVVKFWNNPSLRIDVRNSAGNDSGKPDATPRLPKMRYPSKRLGEFFVYAAPLLLMDFTMIKKFAGVPIADIRQSGGYPPLPSEARSNNLLASVSGVLNNSTSSNQTSFNKPISQSFLLPTFHNFSSSPPLQLTRALPPAAPSSRQLALQLLTAFFIYDSLFFLAHLAFHRIKYLARFHAPHHTHAEIHPQVTNQLSIAERLSLVLLANFSLNVIGSHVLTRTIFVPIFVWLLIEVHSGMNLPWGYDKLMPEGWATGPTVHAKHHRVGDGSYAPFFAWWDTLLEWNEKRHEVKSE